MTLKSSDLFYLMRIAYKAGQLQKSVSVMDEALRRAAGELGIGSFELIDAIDQSDPKAVETRLKLIGPWLKWISRPWLMKVLARLLDVPQVRRKIIEKMQQRYRQELDPIAESWRGRRGSS